MAWYDRYNKSATGAQTPSSSPQMANIPAWAGKINQTIALNNKLSTGSNFKSPAIKRAEENKKLGGNSFPKQLPYKASIGTVYKDPTSKKSYEFTQAGWVPVESIVRDPSALQSKAPQSSLGDNPVVKIMAGIQQKVSETIDRAKDPAKRPGLIKDTKEGAKNLAIDLARSIPRSGMTLALSAKGVKEFTPGAERGQGENLKKVEKFLYGDEKIKNVRGSGEDTVLAFGGSQEAAKKYGLPVGVGLAALDFIPGSPGKKKLAETIAKEGGETVIKNLLKKEVKDISEETATSLAKHFAPIKDVKQVEETLNYLTKVDRTKLTGKALMTSSEDILKARRESMGFGGNKVFQKVNESDKGFDFLNRNTQYLKDRYEAENKGKLLNADAVREMFRPVGYNKVNSAEFHEASSALTNDIFRDDLKKLKPGDKYLFTAGSSGAGKTAALEQFPFVSEGVKAGLDGNFSSGSSLKKLKQVIDTGAKPTIAFVHREPQDAWVNGVIKRAANPDNGRVVPLDVFVDNLVDSRNRVLEAADQFGKKIEIGVLDNSHGKGNAQVVKDPLSFLRNIVYNKDDVRETLIQSTIAKIKDGTIKSEETAKQLLGPKYFPQVSRQLKQERFEWSEASKLVKPAKAAEETVDASNFAAKLPSKEYKKLAPPDKPVYGSIVDEVKAGFDAGRKARDEAEKAKVGTIGQRFRTETVDRLTPVFDFVKQAGKDLPIESNPYKKMRLLAGVGGKVESFMEDNIAPILKQEKSRLDDLSVLQVLEREKELVERGLTRRRNAEEIAQGIEELKGKYGAEEFAKLQESSNQLRKVTSGLLERLHTAGIIGDESFDAIKKNNQFYTPMEAVEHIADNLEKNRFGTSNSFNVASQDVINSIKSYTGEVGDPIEATVRQIPKIMALVEKNEAVQSLVKMRNEFPSVYENLIVPIKGEGTPKGMGIINVFENGKNVRYAVPEAVENAVKNLDAESAGILVKVGSIQAKLLRAGATGLNIGFIPVNIIRDVQDALTTELTEKGAIAMTRFLMSYPQAIFSAAGKGKLWREWAKEGGLSSTMTEQLFKKTTKSVNELAGKKTLGGVVKTVLTSPKELIEFANRVGEQSTRLARYKAGKAGGESAAEAAFKSRDISLDFAKAGNKVKVLNQVIPFLNAGIQGSEKLIRLYKDRPLQAIAATGAMFGVPAVALYNYNQQFKDYDDIPDSEKQDNWIIISRDRTEEEKAAGEKVHGIKIAKGFLGRMVANSVDGAMDFLKKKDPSTFISAVGDAAAGISPVGIPYNQEKLGQSLSGILPPWIQAGLEATTNTNLYFNQPIVPKKLQGVKPEEQYKDDTPEVYKKIGKATGQSPLVVENTVNTTTGGLGRQLASIADSAIEGDAKKLKEGTIDQITRRFSGVRSGEATDAEFDEVAKFSEEAKTDSLQKQREAEKLLEEYKQLPKAQVNELAKELKAKDPVLFEKLKTAAQDDKMGLTPLDRFVKSLPVEGGARAKYILQKFNKFETNEQKKAYIVDLREKKVISDKVLKQIRFLREQEQTYGQSST